MLSRNARLLRGSLVHWNADSVTTVHAAKTTDACLFKIPNINYGKFVRDINARFEAAEIFPLQLRVLTAILGAKSNLNSTLPHNPLAENLVRATFNASLKRVIFPKLHSFDEAGSVGFHKNNCQQQCSSELLYDVSVLYRAECPTSLTQVSVGREDFRFWPESLHMRLR